MRVLLIAERLDLCEAHMILELHRRAQVHVILHPECARRSLLEEAGVALTPLPMRGRFDRTAIRTIREVASSCNPLVVHTLRNNRPLANAIWALRKHPASLVAYRGTMGNLSRLDPGSRLTYLNRRVGCLIAVSEAVRQYLLTVGIGPDRVHTIHKGHDPEWYRQDTKPDLTEFGIPEDAFVVGCAANMRPLKGMRYIIESAALLEPDLNVHYLLLGEVRDPDLMPLVESLACRDRVHMPGHRKDASMLLGGCDVSVMGSTRREGLPRAIIEAMSQGIPAIVTDVGGMPELVEDGTSGYVIPPKSAVAFGERIAELAADPERTRRMGDAAAARIREDFSIARTVEKTLGVYAQLTNTA